MTSINWNGNSNSNSNSNKTGHTTRNISNNHNNNGNPRCNKNREKKGSTNSNSNTNDNKSTSINWNSNSNSNSNNTNHNNHNNNNNNGNKKSKSRGNNKSKMQFDNVKAAKRRKLSKHGHSTNSVSQSTNANYPGPAMISNTENGITTQYAHGGRHPTISNRIKLIPVATIVSKTKTKKSSTKENKEKQYEKEQHKRKLSKLKLKRKQCKMDTHKKDKNKSNDDDDDKRKRNEQRKYQTIGTTAANKTGTKRGKSVSTNSSQQNQQSRGNQRSNQTTTYSLFGYVVYLCIFPLLIGKFIEMITNILFSTQTILVNAQESTFAMNDIYCDDTDAEISLNVSQFYSDFDTTYSHNNYQLQRSLINTCCASVATEAFSLENSQICIDKFSKSLTRYIFDYSGLQNHFCISCDNGWNGLNYDCFNNGRNKCHIHGNYSNTVCPNIWGNNIDNNDYQHNCIDSDKIDNYAAKERLLMDHEALGMIDCDCDCDKPEASGSPILAQEKKDNTTMVLNFIRNLQYMFPLNRNRVDFEIADIVSNPICRSELFSPCFAMIENLGSALIDQVSIETSELSLIVKIDNRRQHNSNEWFLGKSGFCDAFKCEYLFCTDAYTRFDKRMSDLVRYLDNHETYAGVTGRPRAMTRGDQGVKNVEFRLSTEYLLRLTQLYDFELAGSVFNPTYHLISFLPVLPGPRGLFVSNILRLKIDSRSIPININTLVNVLNCYQTDYQESSMVCCIRLNFTELQSLDCYINCILNICSILIVKLIFKVILQWYILVMKHG